jgi:Fic-DOC domain mobile mystery protein B
MTDSSWLSEAEEGQTILGPDDRTGLRPTWISTRAELNQAEQTCIRRALTRLGSPTAETILDDLWLRGLHRRMFSDVWDWAGRYRQTQTNLGVEPTIVAMLVRDLVRDALAWPDEGVVIAVRFHHRLLVIHPFVNGNGRHARIAAGALSRALHGPALGWGIGLRDPELARRRYLAALRHADAGDLGPLIEIATT